MYGGEARRLKFDVSPKLEITSNPAKKALEFPQIARINPAFYI